MLYLCCTKLSFTTVNPLFIGYSVAIYDKPMLAAAILLNRSGVVRITLSLCSKRFKFKAVSVQVCTVRMDDLIFFEGWEKKNQILLGLEKKILS